MGPGIRRSRFGVAAPAGQRRSEPALLHAAYMPHSVNKIWIVAGLTCESKPRKGCGFKFLGLKLELLFLGCMLSVASLMHLLEALGSSCVAVGKQALFPVSGQFFHGEPSQ